MTDRDSCGLQCGELAPHWMLAKKLTRFVGGEINWTGGAAPPKALSEVRSLCESLILGLARTDPTSGEPGRKLSLTLQAGRRTTRKSAETKGRTHWRQITTGW